MIRPNDFAETNREDDLLKRLKQCVGSLDTASKDHKRIPSSREKEITINNYTFSHEPLNERKFELRSTFRNSIGNK